MILSFSMLSLNPCFNGICSARQLLGSRQLMQVSLNPCFNGICSARSSHSRLTGIWCEVLILVLMEYALRAWTHSVIGRNNHVLILVLMEYALRESVVSNAKYLSGYVLILVLMEYALRELRMDSIEESDLWVLILVLMEYALRGSLQGKTGSKSLVLILVLMEYALRG